MEYENEFLSDEEMIEEEFEDSGKESSSDIKLITSILRPIEDESILDKSIKSLDSLIESEFQELIKELKNQVSFFKQAKSILRSLEEFSRIPLIFSKRIIGIGGSFSAGKSRFINSLLEFDVLPTDTTPTTSFPTFIISGDSNKAMVYNSFNNKIDINMDDLKDLSHALNQKYSMSFSHVIKKIILESTSFRYDNLAILDTPGYTKPEGTKKGDLTDEAMAREQLNESDFIIWLIDIEKGTIPSTDLEFLKRLNTSSPLFFVINKSDLKDTSARLAVYDSIIESLRQDGIEYKGICLYSSKEKKHYYGDDLHECLSEINGCVNFRTIESINNSITVLMKSLDEDINNSINSLKGHLYNYNKVLIFDTDLENLDGNLREKMVESREKLKKSDIELNSVSDSMKKFEINFKKEIQKILNAIEKENNFELDSLAKYVTINTESEKKLKPNKELEKDCKNISSGIKNQNPATTLDKTSSEEMDKNKLKLEKDSIKNRVKEPLVKEQIKEEKKVDIINNIDFLKKNLDLVYRNISKGE